MVRYKVYQVIQEYDPAQDYGVRVYPKEAKCLAILRKGQVLTQKQFLDENSKFKSFKIYQRLINLTFGTGAVIGTSLDSEAKKKGLEN